MSVAESILGELVALCPNFAPTWEDEKGLWLRKDGSFTVHGVFSVLSHYVGEQLIQGNDRSPKTIFEYVESKLTDDGSDVENAACTCFLENLINRTPDPILPQVLVPLLGPKSRQFCRAWGEW